MPEFVFALAQAEPTRVVLERSTLEQAALVGQALASVLVLVLLVVASMTLLALRRAMDELTRLVRNTSSDITAAVHDAREVADELRAMTSRVRGSADVIRGGVEAVRGAADAAKAFRKGRRRRRRGGPRDETRGPRLEGGESAADDGSDE